MTMSTVCTLFAVAFTLIFAGVAAANGPEDRETACKDLAYTDFSTLQDAPTQILESRIVGEHGGVASYCHVEGYVWPQVGFELSLPIDSWNGKFVEVGTGGYAGSTKLSLSIESCAEALRRGYACIQSDHGHSSSKTQTSPWMLSDGIWAYQNPQAEIDYGFRALHVVALAGKAITERYYSKPPARSYFLGCSGGGRQGVVAAQRFPWDFDGIVAIDPALDITDLVTAFIWNIVALTDDNGRSLFSQDDLNFLHAKVTAACDADDGVEDGVIDDPRMCHFDPGVLQCKSGKRDQCLSKAQVEAARKVYAGPTTSSGERIYIGRVMPGAELGVLGFGAAAPFYQEVWSNFFRYMAFSPDAGPDWRPRDMDFDADYKRLGVMESIYAASNPDLRKFKSRGGKLIIAQGWDDSGNVIPLKVIDYYETVQRTMGGRAATEEFARLFMMPGRAHCGAGPGANTVDLFGYLDAWVEDGEAPDMMVAGHVADATRGDFLKGPDAFGDRVEFTRPLYPYPIKAKYDGQGDPDDYRSFGPFDPSAAKHE